MLAIVLAVVLAANVGAELRKIAVVDFEDKTDKHLYSIGQVANELMSVSLAKSGLFDVVERVKLNSIMQEHDLTVSGLVDNTRNMLTLGKLLNADAIITGAVIEFSNREITTTAYNITTKKISYHLEASVKELDVNTSKIAFADFFTADYDYLVTSGSVKLDDIHRQLLKTALTKATDAIVALEKAKGQPVETSVTVTVSFASDPAGADVVVDGVYQGATPLDVTLKEGIHVVKISKGGYQPWENKVNVVQGMSRSPLPWGRRKSSSASGFRNRFKKTRRAAALRGAALFHGVFSKTHRSFVPALKACRTRLAAVPGS